MSIDIDNYYISITLACRPCLASCYILVTSSVVVYDLHIFLLSVLLSSVPVVLYLRVLGGCDKLHCVLDLLWLSQKRWDVHFSGPHVPSQYVPGFLV